MNFTIIFTSFSICPLKVKCELEISSDDIVLDDIFKISTGNQIPTDGIVKSGYVEVNESLLTGESVPVKKNVGDEIMRSALGGIEVTLLAGVDIREGEAVKSPRLTA